MKQAQNARKGRARSSSRKNGGKGSGQGNSRQDNKVRGNPKQLLEKYKTQAREARQAGDRVQAEYYYQFADHYQRVLNEMRGPGAYVSDDEDTGAEAEGNVADGAQPQQQRQGRGRGRRNKGGDAREDAGDTSGTVDPAAAEQPVEVHPELDLADASEGEGGEKPRRRARNANGAPRRGRPRKAEGDAAPESAPPQDDAAA